MKGGCLFKPPIVRKSTTRPLLGLCLQQSSRGLWRSPGFSNVLRGDWKCVYLRHVQSASRQSRDLTWYL
eukprot:1751392-Amphidinium_carterae.1